MRGEARITIDAPPEQVYALVTDISRMSEWSPETYRAYWLGDAAGPALGARFRGWNKMGVLRWFTNPKVTALEPGRLFEFDTGTTRWRYEFRPVGDGATEVVESFHAKDIPVWSQGMQMLGRGRSLQRGIEETLRRLKTGAEPTP